MLVIITLSRTSNSQFCFRQAKEQKDTQFWLLIHPRLLFCFLSINTILNALLFFMNKEHCNRRGGRWWRCRDDPLSGDDDHVQVAPSSLVRFPCSFVAQPCVLVAIAILSVACAVAIVQVGWTDGCRPVSETEEELKGGGWWFMVGEGGLWILNCYTDRNFYWSKKFFSLMIWLRTDFFYYQINGAWV